MEPIVLAFERGADLWGWTTSRKSVRLLKNARCAAFSPDGKSLAFVRGDSLWAASLAASDTARRLCRLPALPQYPGDVSDPALSWHPTHPLIAFSCPESHESSLLSIFVVPAAGGEAQPWIRTSPQGWDSLGTVSASHPRFTSDGKSLAFVRVGALWIARIAKMASTFGCWEPGWWDWEERGVAGSVHDGGGRGTSDVMGYARSSWFPDGRQIAVECRRWNGSSYFWIDVLRRAPDGSFQKCRHISVGRAPAVTPEGRRLVYQEGADLACLDLKIGRTRRLLRDAVAPICNPTLAVWWRRFRLPLAVER